MRRLGVIVLCVCSLIGLAPSAPAAAVGRTEAAERMMIKLNEVRARHGLGPFRSSPSLLRTSRSFSKLMIRRDRFGHGPRVRASRKFSMLGEALAIHRGRRWGIRRTVRRWLASPSHRYLVLNSQMPWAGAGVSRGRFGSGQATIWVLQLGRR